MGKLLPQANRRRARDRRLAEGAELKRRAAPIIRRKKTKLEASDLPRDRETHAALLRAILAVGTLTALAAQKIKIPDVAAFLVVGMLVARHRDSFPVRGAGPPRALDVLRDAVHVLDPRDRRHYRRALAGLLLGMKAPARTDDRLGHFHRHPDDDFDPGADHRMAGAQARAVGGTRKAIDRGNRVARLIPICKSWTLAVGERA